MDRSEERIFETMLQEDPIQFAAKLTFSELLKKTNLTKAVLESYPGSLSLGLES